MTENALITENNQQTAQQYSRPSKKELFCMHFNNYLTLVDDTVQRGNKSLENTQC